MFLIFGKEQGAIAAEVEDKAEIGNILGIEFIPATIGVRCNNQLKYHLQCNMNIFIDFSLPLSRGQYPNYGDLT